MLSRPTEPPAELTENYLANGFAYSPPLLEAASRARAVEQFEAVVAGRFVTGRAPLSGYVPPSELDPSGLSKIDQPQLCDPAINAVVAHPAVGRWAAAVTGAELIQVWAVQLLEKRPGGSAAATVGWHQDDDYWHDWWEGEVFTCWLAISDVTPESGAMRFVAGSHEWGFLRSGDFFDTNLDDAMARFAVPEGQSWEEVQAPLPAGSASLHHKHTIHGSGHNVADMPRRSYAIHLRTERSRPLPGLPRFYAEHLDDPEICPVAYRGPGS